MSRTEFATGEFAPCEECTQPVAWHPSYYYNSPAQRFDPVVIHRDAAGNVRFPGNTNAPVPEGFQKVELRDMTEIRKFEGEMNRKDASAAADFHAAQQSYRAGQLAHNREQLARGFATHDEAGRPVTVSLDKFSPRGREFYEAMRKQSDARTHRAARPEFYIEAFTQNASNRDDHHDPSVSYGIHRK